MAAFPGFQNITLRGLTAGIIRDWITWAADNGLSGRVINRVLQDMRTPLRYAVMGEEIPQDPYRNIKNAPETQREKGVRGPAAMKSRFRLPAGNYKHGPPGFSFKPRSGLSRVCCPG
jgi:hypothetical protein